MKHRQFTGTTRSTIRAIQDIERTRRGGRNSGERLCGVQGAPFGRKQNLSATESRQSLPVRSTLGASPATAFRRRGENMKADRKHAVKTGSRGTIAVVWSELGQTGCLPLLWLVPAREGTLEPQIHCSASHRAFSSCSLCAVEGFTCAFEWLASNVTSRMCASAVSLDLLFFPRRALKSLFFKLFRVPFFSRSDAGPIPHLFLAEVHLGN